jgi:hypothetical protein
MSQYDEYCNFIRDCDYTDFKQSNKYCGILEHVTKILGNEYLDLIDTEFQLSFDDMFNFMVLNDRIGNTKKENFYSTKHKKVFDCSPTSLRYIYHALIILKYYKETGLKEIVEVGCGYGGLCLAINYFSKLLNITINKYHLIDLPDVCNLINYYLGQHANFISIPYQSYDAQNYGKEITSNDLFFISNYCLSEIDEQHYKLYCQHLLPKTSHGFIIWQPVSWSLENIMILQKVVTLIENEKPQTCCEGINRFVYF